jgi:hypothetical protein
MDFLERCITILNEMALDPEIYPRQECPIVFLYPGEDYADKRAGYMIDLGLSEADMVMPVIFRQYHVIRNASGNGNGEETSDAPCTCGFEVVATVSAGSDMETTMRSVYPVFFGSICNAFDAWSAEHGCTPRFALVSIFRMEDNYTVEGDIVIRVDVDIMSISVQ